MTNLTQNEIIALKTCVNYKTREGQLCDNYSNGGQEEFKQALGWNDKQVSALIGSLEDKKMGYGDDNEGNGHIFWLSELGVNTIFDIIESETSSEPIPTLRLELKAETDRDSFHFGRIFNTVEDVIFGNSQICEMDKYVRNEGMLARKIEILNLLAAAPELFESLKNVQSYLIGLANSKSTPTKISREIYNILFISGAQSAITKAEGK